ncbi:unnamed protein product [Diabrotica balteata]|uniref:DUF4371 domain-containing protein n=1 Tax=Diabrotica balteata TaxID=107213 RepID=A0A9N9SRX9_DIABA|nr:unnamed protein product [Diabrotica balteata]
MEIKQEQNKFLDENCKIEIENIDFSHVKDKIKLDSWVTNSFNTDTINNLDQLNMEVDVKDIKLEKHKSEPLQFENGCTEEGVFCSRFARLKIKNRKIKYNAEVKMNRKIIKKLVSLTCTLAKQELAFRGHEESDDSLNPGNFKAIWELILKSTREQNDHWQKKI